MFEWFKRKSKEPKAPTLRDLLPYGEHKLVDPVLVFSELKFGSHIRWKIEGTNLNICVGQDGSMASSRD